LGESLPRERVVCGCAVGVIRKMINDVLSLDELALIFRAVDRSDLRAGALALAAAGAVCRSWRDVLRSPEGLTAWHILATGTTAQRLWELPRHAGHLPVPPMDGEALHRQIHEAKLVARSTQLLGGLGGLPRALQSDTHGDVLVSQVPGGEWQFRLDPAAAAADDRAIRSTHPFPPVDRFGEETIDDDADAKQADGIADYWNASRRTPRRVCTQIWQPRLVPKQSSSPPSAGKAPAGDGYIKFVPLELHYFEVSLEQRPTQLPSVQLDECIAVGLCTGRFRLHGSQPGWKSGSVGYHSDDGNFFSASGQGRPYGPRYGDGDVVGCGVCLLTRSVFFTLNGEFLGIAKYDWNTGDRALYPVVGVGSHACGTINFGTFRGDGSAASATSGFLFDPATWPAVRAAEFQRSPPPPTLLQRNRLPEGLEALEPLEVDHPVVVALLQMLGPGGALGDADANADADADADADRNLRERRAHYLRQLVARLGRIEDGEFVINTDEDDDTDDDEDGGGGGDGEGEGGGGFERDGHRDGLEHNRVATNANASGGGGGVADGGDDSDDSDDL
jgi:hypothetical protein